MNSVHREVDRGLSRLYTVPCCPGRPAGPAGPGFKGKTKSGSIRFLWLYFTVAGENQ